ncbi:hypothetical protein H4Q26_014413 [Puccinia striiformis f. sp. tritici PST-130]|nr:hypothetical protein H4Q26_014413 [Puccinia striiformis f. sp. tritici PST-130]
MDSEKLAGAQKLLDMFLPNMMARSAAYDAEDEQARRRRQKRRPKHSRAQAAAPTSTRPLPKGVKLPYLDQKAIAFMRKDYDCKERKVPTSHPNGPRHARIYTLIGRGSSAPPRQRGTPSRPAPNAEVTLKRRPPPLAIPALNTQAGPSRSDRTQVRTEPYAETSRLSRVTGLRRH